jgi:hypothetical protein
VRLIIGLYEGVLIIPWSELLLDVHAILTETLGENAPSYATVENWWPGLNMVIFPSVMRLVLDDPKQ